MQSLDDDYDDFFNPALFLNEKFVAANRALFQDKVVLEIGAGAGLAGFVASQFASRTAITDGNDVVLRLLDQNADQASTPCGVFKLLWGEEDSVVQFQKDFPHPIDILLGADVVCWPNLVLPLLRTIKTHQVSGGLIYVLIYAACALLLERNEIQFVVLVQFAYIPLFVKNYGLALLNVSFGLFLWTHVVCGVRTLLTVYIGHSATHMTQLLKSHAASGDTVTAQEILMVVAVVSTLLLVAVGSYRTKQYLDELAASELVPPVDKDRIVSCEV
ncbi:hypothetical protein DYB28_009504 [Aphanomyces astaci]|uniref:Uncharacterized protein n=1 Tax=Aphanomyces astaci TaxID=112090 RepID=A0A9X8HDA5_APHAT|nr:hypothetical protein DYB28_009504 [Aphanomyces astaci]